MHDLATTAGDLAHFSEHAPSAKPTGNLLVPQFPQTTVVRPSHRTWCGRQVCLLLYVLCVVSFRESGRKVVEIMKSNQINLAG